MNLHHPSEEDEAYKSPPLGDSPDSGRTDRTGPEAVRRGPWSPEEDEKLMDIISLHGPSNWVRISLSIKTRSPKQCRERYHQNLKPSLNRHPITQDEGVLIERLVKSHGKKWAEIARHLPGRSDNAIKNWWNGGANRRRRASYPHVRLSQKLHHSGQVPQMLPAPHMPEQYRAHLYGAYSSGHSPAGGSDGFLPLQGRLKTFPGPMLHTPVQQAMMPPAFGGYSHFEAAPMPRYVRADSSPKFLSSTPAAAHNPATPSCVSRLPSFPQVAFNTGIFNERSPQGSHIYSHNNSSESLDSNTLQRVSLEHSHLPKLVTRISGTSSLDGNSASLSAPSLTTLPPIHAGDMPHAAASPGDVCVARRYDSWGSGSSIGASSTSTGYYDYKGHNHSMVSKSSLSSTPTSRRPSSTNEAHSFSGTIPDACSQVKEVTIPEHHYREAGHRFSPKRPHKSDNNFVAPPFKHLMKSIDTTPVSETGAGTEGDIRVSRLIN